MFFKSLACSEHLLLVAAVFAMPEGLAIVSNFNGKYYGRAFPKYYGRAIPKYYGRTFPKYYGRAFPIVRTYLLLDSLRSQDQNTK